MAKDETKKSFEELLAESLNSRKNLNKEEALKQQNYLDELFETYSSANRAQTLVSTGANLANFGVNLSAYNKQMDLLKTPDFDVPGKTDVTLKTPNVFDKYERFADKSLIAGAKSAREAGRADLIPEITYQSEEMIKEGIGQQAMIDTQVYNQQAQLDATLEESAKSREFQRDASIFQSENQMILAKAGFQEKFAQALRQNISAQADIANRGMVNPIGVQTDWLDKYGWINEGIFEKQV